MTWLRGLIVLAGLLASWHAVATFADLPPFILPRPVQVGHALLDDAALLADHGLITLAEIALGLAFGAGLGMITALTMAAFRPARRWMLPLLVASQAIPIFAIAPILVIWFGFGIWPKVAVATLIIYFPVAIAFFDGLRRTDPGWLDLARTMGATRFAMLRHIRLPAALPALASGLRVGVAVAPIGAVFGEWVGARAGLGHLMLQANARVETARLYAALIVLAGLAVALYVIADRLLSRAVSWQRETNPALD